MVSIANIVSMVDTKMMKPMNKIDGHTHILPSIDDGSQSEAQSYRMLKLEKDNGIGVVLATPHFYPDHLSVKEFVKVRQGAYDKLMTYIKAKEDQEDLPIIRQGAEVLLCTETADLEDLRDLAIEGTDYILIEMPYQNWQEWMYESIEKIRVRHHLIPVIAHVERYVPMHNDTDQIYRLLSMKGVLGQMNISSVLDRMGARLCHKLIVCQMVHILGSDAHRGKHLLEITKGRHCLEKKHGEAVLRKLDQQGIRLLNNEPIKKEMPVPFTKVWGSFYR